MKDTVNRQDVLDEIEKYRSDFHKENMRRDRKHDWDSRYPLEKLAAGIENLPASVPAAGRQIVKRAPWTGEYHVCSECGKLIPYIDWCEPYCSGCGCHLEYYRDYEDEKKEKKSNPDQVGD